jgi:hypothetical protein
VEVGWPKELEEDEELNIGQAYHALEERNPRAHDSPGFHGILSLLSAEPSRPL